MLNQTINDASICGQLDLKHGKKNAMNRTDKYYVKVKDPNGK